MPITEDITENEIFGVPFRHGRVEGRVELLIDQLESRFGRVPPGTRARLAALTADELRAAGLRLLAASTIEDIFTRQI